MLVHWRDVPVHWRRRSRTRLALARYALHCAGTVGVGAMYGADADTMCSSTGAGTAITAGAGLKYPSNGAGAQYTASAGATGVLLPVKVPSVYDLAHTTTP